MGSHENRNDVRAAALEDLAEQLNEYIDEVHEYVEENIAPLLEPSEKQTPPAGTMPPRHRPAPEPLD